jgi:hypothetical protein
MWPIAVNITLLILGLAFIVGKKRRKTMLLLGAFWSGVALSAPFVGSVGGDRIWLCLAPYVVLPFLIGLFVVSESVLISIRPKKPVAQDFIAEKAALALAIFIVLRTVFGPLLMQWHYRDKYPTLAASTSCERIFWNADYIPVRFSSNTARPVSFSPFLKSSRFKKIDESKDVYVFYPFGGRNPARIGYMKQDDAPEHTGWHYLEQDPEKKNFYRRCKPEETKHGLIE